MKLFWSPRTRAARVAWMLAEAGLEYERVTIDIHDPKAKEAPDFAAASPMGKVPALEDGEVRMADSAAICMYLADRYPAAGLAPALDDPKRGAYLFWMVFGPGVMEPALGEKFAGVEPNRLSSGWGDFDTMIEVLEAPLRNSPWLLGDTFSAADVMVGSGVHFMHLFKALPASAVLDAYRERCEARPAFQAAMALNDSTT